MGAPLLVRLIAREQTLLSGVTPASVAPYLRMFSQTSHSVVRDFHEEVDAKLPTPSSLNAHEMDVWLFQLND